MCTTCSHGTLQHVCAVQPKVRLDRIKMYDQCAAAAGHVLQSTWLTQLASQTQANQFFFCMHFARMDMRVVVKITGTFGDELGCKTKTCINKGILNAPELQQPPQAGWYPDRTKCSRVRHGDCYPYPGPHNGQHPNHCPMHEHQWQRSFPLSVARGEIGGPSCSDSQEQLLQGGLMVHC
jgi:hypothetical protein